MIQAFVALTQCGVVPYTSAFRRSLHGPVHRRLSQGQGLAPMMTNRVSGGVGLTGAGGVGPFARVRVKTRSSLLRRPDA